MPYILRDTDKLQFKLSEGSVGGTELSFGIKNESDITDMYILCWLHC